MDEQPRIFTYSGQMPTLDVNPALKEAIALMNRQLDVIQSLAHQTMLIPAGTRLIRETYPQRPNIANEHTAACYVCDEHFVPGDRYEADPTGPRHPHCHKP